MDIACRWLIFYKDRDMSICLYGIRKSGVSQAYQPESICFCRIDSPKLSFLENQFLEDGKQLAGLKSKINQHSDC
jgi:hypothetical protein